MNTDAPHHIKLGNIMKENSATLKQFKIGLTVFAGSVIFLVLMFIIGSVSNMFSSTYTVRLFLKNTSGLAKGTMVSLGGLKIGNVAGLAFGEQSGRRGVVVTVKLRTEYQPQITTGSVASVSTIGMLGDKFVDISIGTTGEQPLQDGDFITVKPTMEMGDVIDKFSDMMDDVGATISNVRGITDTVRQGSGAIGKLLCDDEFAAEISGITHKLHLIATSLTERKGTLGKLMQDDALYAKLDRTVSNLSTMTDSLSSGRGTAGKLLMNDSLYMSLQSISRRMDAMLSKMDSDSSSVGPFLNSNASHRQLTELVTNINSLVADIKENPKKYVKLSLF